MKAKFFKRFIIVLTVLALILFFYNQIVKIKFGTNLITYLKYSSQITKEEKNYLENHGPIQLASDITAPPISYYDEDKQEYAGLIVDYANYLSLEMETPINIRMYTFYELVENLRDKKIDACDMFFSEARSDEFNLSIPIYRLKTFVISSKTKFASLKPSNLGGKTLAIPKGDLAEDYISELLIKYHSKSAEFVHVDNTKMALELLQKGKVDAAIGDEVVVSNYWKEFDVYETQKYNVELLYEKDVVLAVNKEDKQLLSVLNKGILQSKKTNIVSKVQQKWFGISESIRGEEIQNNAILSLALIVMLIALSLYVWNFLLKKTVKEKTREISNAKENVSLILNNLNTALLIVDIDAQIIEYNKALLSLIGDKEHILTGKSIFNVKVLNDILIEKLPDSIFSSATNVSFVSVYNNRCYDVKISPYISQKDNLRILSIDDITEKLIVERKLHQENKMMAMGQLSVGLSHEIRNPLGIIRNGVYLIKMDMSTETKNKAIAMMENAINRINNLIEHLLSFSRSTADRYVKEDISVLVENTVTLMASKLKKKDIHLEFNHTGNKFVEMNLESINIILVNLIENAIDSFADDTNEKTITLDILAEESALKIIVADNGCGIPSNNLESIFEPFYTTKDIDHGSGLGLYLVYNEVKKYNGDISVESTVGVGTKFNIFIDFERVEYEN